MKRILCIPLMLLVLTCPVASAAKRGETVTVTFEIVDNEFEAISARIGISFAPNVFEFVSAEKISPDVLTGAPATPEASFGLVNMGGITPGVLGTVTLRIKEDAPSGVHEVAPKVDSVYNAAREEVLLNVKGEKISLEHVWDLGRVTVEATCYSEGVMRYRCLYCEAAREEVIPTTEHAEGSPIATTVATCTRDGWQIYPCAICGDVLREEALPATGPARHPGDADGSGFVNIFDALIILQHDTGWQVDINLSNADVDANRDINIFDALLILQHDVGWDVELK